MLLYHVYNVVSLSQKYLNVFLRRPVFVLGLFLGVLCFH